MKQLIIYLGPILSIAIGFVMKQYGETPEAAWTAGVTLLCALWWVFEPIPIPATSLIPLAIFPLAGVLSGSEVGAAYGNPMVLLMLGGFMLSAAMERSGAHRRIALSMVSLFGGTSSRGLVFGFMAASAFLSMWISNAATTLMLLPIVMAVLAQTEDRKLTVALLLGVCYSASVGGIVTPIGTPPNLVFMDAYQRSTGLEPTFTQWMGWAGPIALVMLPIVGLWLTRGLGKLSDIRMPDVGAWRQEEIRTLLVFFVTAVLWITRKQPFGGWSEWTGLSHANDASVALLSVVAMFLIPNGVTGVANNEDEPTSAKSQSKLLDWKTAAGIEWGVLILFGGGIAIANAFKSSGLADSLGNAMASAGTWPLLLLVAGVCFAVTFLTEVTSNTATTTLLMPILASAALAAGIEPRLIMVPAAISASFAFMLPVATPPNAIVFGSGELTVKTMAREGLILNLIGVVVVTAVCAFVL